MIEIKESTIENLPDIVKLYQSIEFEYFEPSMIALEKIYIAMKKYPYYKVFVVVKNDEIIGSYALLIMDNLAHQGAKSGIVEDVVVKENFRSQGIGKLMMNHAMSICREFKCYKLVLSSNQVREEAHRFYENLGFERHGFSFQILFE